jgi:hypothetical protein
MVVMVTMIQPIVIMVCVDMITCVEVEGITYVQSDLNLRCHNVDGAYNPVYRPYFYASIVLLFSALVLLPLTFLYILKRNHSIEKQHAIETFQNWDSVLNRYGILFRFYPTQGPYKLFFSKSDAEVTVESFHYLWETLLLSRNGLLIVLVKALPVLLASYSTNAQLISSSVVCLVLLIWIIMHVAYRPYGSTANFTIASAINAIELVSLFLVTLLVVVYPITAAIEEQRTQEVLDGIKRASSAWLPSEVVTLMWLFFMLSVLMFLVYVQLFALRLANGSVFGACCCENFKCCRLFCCRKTSNWHEEAYGEESPESQRDKPHIRLGCGEELTTRVTVFEKSCTGEDLKELPGDDLEVTGQQIRIPLLPDRKAGSLH